MSSSTLALLMIVRDEAPVITRALTSVQHLIDNFIIMDTGSVDGTPEIIQQWALENNKTGTIIYEAWQNYGYNKTKLIQHAHQHLPDITYFFFLDADEVFITEQGNPLSYPTKSDRDTLVLNMDFSPKVSVFQLTTLYGNLRYRRWQLVRNNQLYEWKQPVHEYLEGVRDNTTKHIEWLYNLARKEGNSSRNPDRYRKDAEMFLDFLKDHPGEARATFYLAQSYESYGDSAKALEYYKKRSDIIEGFYQERYIACLRVGRISKDYTERLTYFMKGYTICPHRLECIYEMMMTHNSKGHHHAVVATGMLAPCEGMNERQMRSDDLFVETHIYEYRFDFDFAVSCYYTKDWKLGREANQRARRKAPQNIKDRIDSNMNFFPKHEQVGGAAQTLSAPLPASADTMFSSKPEVNIVVIDNFYSNPDEVRAFALKQDYSVRGNYPGYRTECIKEYHEKAKAKFEHILQQKITYWPEGYNASFQYATSDMRSWLHRDNTEYSAIVYLSPDAPVASGTKFYRHKRLMLETKQGSEETERLLQNDTYKDSAWDLVDHVGNKYNRCVIFRGKRTHISGDYFGSSKEDGRLFQMFFFN